MSLTEKTTVKANVGSTISIIVSIAVSTFVVTQKIDSMERDIKDNRVNNVSVAQWNHWRDNFMMANDGRVPLTVPPLPDKSVDSAARIKVMSAAQAMWDIGFIP